MKTNIIIRTHISRYLAILVVGLVTLSLATPAFAISKQRLINETNLVRASQGVHRLKGSSSLDRAAVQKAYSMFRLQYFGHTSPRGEKFWSFLGRYSYKFTRYGENLGRGYKSEKSLVRAWMGSSGHRANLISQSYTHMGIGIRSGNLFGRRTTVVVQMFGKKRGTTTPLTTASAR